VKVNTVELEDVATLQSIDVLPTIQFFKAGTKIGEIKGSDVAKLEATIRGYA